MHSLAAIEQWAIDLAIDVVCRFWNWRVGSVDGKEGRRLPMSFFADFLKVAEDEAKHFTLLRKVSRALRPRHRAVLVPFSRPDPFLSRSA